MIMRFLSGVENKYIMYKSYIFDLDFCYFFLFFCLL